MRGMAAIVGACLGLLAWGGGLASPPSTTGAQGAKVQGRKGPKQKAKRAHRPWVIAHRGASGRLPEHTLEAYRRALKLGADAIEPDLVATKDGVLIARHENELSDTTDVAKKFPRRKRSQKIDGRTVTGWFSEDFTWAEIRSLRATQRLPFRDQRHNGKYAIPSFAQILKLLVAHRKRSKRKVALVPELKHSSHFRARGLALEPRLLKLLKTHKLHHKDAGIYVQSFEVSNLQWLRKRSPVKLVQLYSLPSLQPYDFTLKKDKRSYGDLLRPKGLRFVARYAHAIGPWKGLLWAPKGDQKRFKFKANPRLVAEAHSAGLKVFAYTFRDEARYLAPRFGKDPLKEYRFFAKFKLDAVFSDFPATALKAYGKP